jgi:hypothetical protein
MPGPLWSAMRWPRRWVVAVAGTASVAGSLLAVANEKERTCGLVPLPACIVQRARDLYRSQTTRSCDARILPSVRARHRAIARRYWRNGEWRSWLAENAAVHARRLRACQAAKSSSGPAAVEEEACRQLRESGHLMLYVIPPSWDGGVLDSTERTLDCAYDLTAGDGAAGGGPVPGAMPGLMSWAYGWRVAPRTWGPRHCDRPGQRTPRFMSARRRVPAARWGPSSP